MPKASASQLLAKGESTGAIMFRAADGVAKLQVRTGERGRGLFAAGSFKKGDIVTTVFGHLAHTSDEIDSTSERYQWSKDQVFVMQFHASHLGIFINTSASHLPNNCRFSCSRRQKQIMNVVATRNIAPGDEILAPYGSAYVTRIKNAVICKKKHQDVAERTMNAAFPAFVQGAVTVFRCANCGKIVKKSVRKTHGRCCMGLLTAES
jgi:hypothetical protein